MSDKPKFAAEIERIAKERGEIIRIEREARGWSQAELASIAGTNQQTVDRIERGVTVNSKAFPAIREALKLDPQMNNFSAVDSAMKHGTPHPPRPPDSVAAENIKRGDHIPVFQLDGRMQLVDAIPRHFPVQFAENAFAVIVQTSDMEPAFNPGDLAIVNPNLPALPGCDVVLGWPKGAGPRLRIRRLVGESDDAWIVKTWRPDREESLSKSEFPRHEVIVARISRYR